MWPEGAKCAVCLTFDFDAESAVLGRAIRTGTQATLTPLSRGRYGANVGVFRVLDLLKRHQIIATFFIPGYTVEKYSEAVKQIDAQGHEIAHHGYYHENPTIFAGDLDKERDVLTRGSEIIEKTVGYKPVGYRSPAWDLNPESPKLLLEHGLIYESSLMDQEKPYRLTIDGKESNLVEIPIDWVLDDFPHFQYNPGNPSTGFSAPSKVYEIWAAEFSGYYEGGGCFNLTMHPQVIGRFHRIQVLDRLIRHIKGHHGVWFARCDEVAKHVLKTL